MDAGEHGRRIVAVLHLRAVRRSIDRPMAVQNPRMAAPRARHLAVLVRRELRIPPTLRAPHHPVALLLVVPFISQAVLAVRAAHDLVRPAQAVIHEDKRNFVIIYVTLM